MEHENRELRPEVSGTLSFTVWKAERLTTGFLSSLSTLRQSSRNDDIMPDFGLVKRLLMKLSGAFVSSSLYRN